jgi:hypothetical protein
MLMTPEDRLIRSLPALRELIDSLAARSPSEANELLKLDFLVRKHPAAAQMSLRLRQRARTDLSAPPGWAPSQDTGLPLWRWLGGNLYVATDDMDRLRFLGTTLARFDHMTAKEIQGHVRRRPGEHANGSMP